MNEQDEVVSAIRWTSLIGLLAGVAALMIAAAIVMAATRPELVDRCDLCAMR